MSVHKSLFRQIKWVYVSLKSYMHRTMGPHLVIIVPPFSFKKEINFTGDRGNVIEWDESFVEKLGEIMPGEPCSLAFFSYECRLSY